MTLSRRCEGEWWEFIIDLAMIMGILFMVKDFSHGFAEGCGGGSCSYGHETILSMNTSLRILEGGWREYGSGFTVVMYL